MHCSGKSFLLDKQLTSPYEVPGPICVVTPDVMLAGLATKMRRRIASVGLIQIKSDTRFQLVLRHSIYTSLIFWELGIINKYL